MSRVDDRRDETCGAGKENKGVFVESAHKVPIVFTLLRISGIIHTLCLFYTLFPYPSLVSLESSHTVVVTRKRRWVSERQGRRLRVRRVATTEGVTQRVLGRAAVKEAPSVFAGLSFEDERGLSSDLNPTPTVNYPFPPVSPRLFTCNMDYDEEKVSCNDTKRQLPQKFLPFLEISGLKHRTRVGVDLKRSRENRRVDEREGKRKTRGRG